MSNSAAEACHPAAKKAIDENPITVGYRKGETLPFKSVDSMANYIANVRPFVDATFADPMGMVHHFTMSPNQCELHDLTNGWAFDGSSIRLFKSIEESDMLLIPDPKTCFIDPFTKHLTLHVTCNVAEADGSPFDRCPRTICERAEAFVLEQGICEQVVVGPEVEFFLFDSVSFSANMNESHFRVDAEEGYWKESDSYQHCLGRSKCADFSKTEEVQLPRNIGNLGQRMLRKQYYAPTIPIDRDHDVRNDMVMVMEDIGIPTEKHHHEVAAAQQELGITCSTMLETADNVVNYKYVVKNVASIHHKSATFMAKPMAGDNGSGMHLHASLWSANKNLFYDPEGTYQELSKTALHFIGGLLKHAPALLAICCPTVNSFKRLTPGYEAPSILSFSAGNRSACVRIPIVGKGQWRAKRMEFRCPDPTANPYLAVSALIMAGIDGILNQIDAPAPLNTDVAGMTLKDLERAATGATPATLWAALDELEKDREFLQHGKVFSSSFLDAYIAFKRHEYREVTNVPTPKEYQWYYGM